MKLRPLVAALVLATAVVVPSPLNAAEKKAEAPAKSHPLKGVITGVLKDKSALLVKHEAIPGVMRAMTMMFKVDAATLAAAKEGQAITGQMSREGNEWVLRDVKPAQ